jgi:hypothetical protein
MGCTNLGVVNVFVSNDRGELAISYKMSWFVFPTYWFKIKTLGNDLKHALEKRLIL